jgi:hypothetical protein
MTLMTSHLNSRRLILAPIHQMSVPMPVAQMLFAPWCAKPPRPLAYPSGPAQKNAPALSPGAAGAATPNPPQGAGPAQPAQAAVGAAVAPVAGHGQPLLRSQLPQPASAVRPEFRDRYLAERQVRFANTPNLWVWDEALWIDPV